MPKWFDQVTCLFLIQCECKIKRIKALKAFLKQVNFCFVKKIIKDCLTTGTCKHRAAHANMHGIAIPTIEMVDAIRVFFDAGFYCSQIHAPRCF